MTEFEEIINNIINDKEFQNLATIKHHEGNRLEHSLQVAKLSYRIAKRLHWDATACARAGLLHDFFGDMYTDDVLGNIRVICGHGQIARENSRRFNLNKKELNIIESHMFPLGVFFPRYKEAWLVSIVDKISAINEFSLNFKYQHTVSVILGVIFLQKLI